MIDQISYLLNVLLEERFSVLFWGGGVKIFFNETNYITCHDYKGCPDILQNFMDV